VILRVSSERVRRASVAAALVLAVLGLAGPWGVDTDSMSAAPAPSAGPGDARQGERRFRQLDCIRCHSEPRSGHGDDVPPSLAIAGSRAETAWMAAYTRSPNGLRYAEDGVRPGLRMPAARVTAAAASDLAAFLAVQVDSVLVPRWLGPSSGAGADSLRAAGEKLFEQYQCRGCHELAGSGGKIGPALDEVGARRRAQYIRALLLDPRRVVPGTAMRKLDLWDEEADALTEYLASLGRERRPE
jgi:nitric oxide reductase subunit C